MVPLDSHPVQIFTVCLTSTQRQMSAMAAVPASPAAPCFSASPRCVCFAATRLTGVAILLSHALGEHSM